MNTTNPTWRDFLRPDEEETLRKIDGDAVQLAKDRLRLRKRGWNRLLIARDKEANHGAP